MWVERSFSCTSEAFHWYNQIHTQDVNHTCRHSNDSRDSFWWKSHVVLFWTWRDRDNDDSYSSQYTKRWNRPRFLSPSCPDFCSGCLVSQNESNLGLVPQVWQHPHQSFTCLSTACRMASVLINKWGYSATFWSMGSILVTFFIAIAQSVCPGPSKLGQSMFQSSIDTFQK